MRLHNFSKQSKVALTPSFAPQGQAPETPSDVSTHHWALRQTEKKGVITIERKRIQSAGLPDS